MSWIGRPSYNGCYKQECIVYKTRSLVGRLLWQTVVEGTPYTSNVDRNPSSAWKQTLPCQVVHMRQCSQFPAGLVQGQVRDSCKLQV